MIHRLPPAPGEGTQRQDESRRERAAAARRAKARRHYERARSRSARRSRRGIFAALALTATLGGAAAAGPLGGALVDRWLAERPLTAVRVIGTQHLTPAAVLELAGLHGGIDAGALATRSVRRALEKHPWVAQARVTRLPTSEVVVSVDERRAHALVATAADTWTLVDAMARPIEDAAPSAWPALTRIHGLEEARDRESRAGEAIAMLPALASAGLQEPLEIEWTGGSERAWVVRADGVGSWPPIELWLAVGGDLQLRRLRELLAAPPIVPGALPQVGAAGPAQSEAAQASAPPASDASSSDAHHTDVTEASDAAGNRTGERKNRVRIDLRFEGRAILAQSDSPSPADASSARPNARN